MHRVSRFVLNDVEEKARVECTCGWVDRANIVSELFESYYVHKYQMTVQELGDELSIILEKE